VNQDRGQRVGSCKYGNEISDCKKRKGLLEQLNDYQLLKDTSPWIYLYIANPDTCYINGIRHYEIFYDATSTLVI
jgi:hypothetical protein